MLPDCDVSVTKSISTIEFPDLCYSFLLGTKDVHPLRVTARYAALAQVLVLLYLLLTP